MRVFAVRLQSEHSYERLLFHRRWLWASVFGQFNFGLMVAGTIVAVVFRNFVSTVGCGSRTQWLALRQHNFTTQAGNIGVDAGRSALCTRTNSSRCDWFFRAFAECTYIEFCNLVDGPRQRHIWQ